MCHVILCYITYGRVMLQHMLYNMFHVMLYNMCYVMLHNICYITCVMSCHIMLCYDVSCYVI